MPAEWQADEPQISKRLPAAASAAVPFAHLVGGRWRYGDFAHSGVAVLMLRV